MSWTLGQVKTADAALPGGPLALQTAADTLNAQTTASPPKDLAWSSIRDVLMNNFDWGTLVQCATAPIGGVLPGGGLQTAQIQAAALGIQQCCLYGGIFGASVQANWNKLTAAAGLLTPAAVAGISSASAAAVVALRTPALPVWSPPLSPYDVQIARTQP